MLDYSVVDQEVMWTLPPKITSGRATFSIRSTPFAEAMQEYRLQGRFGATANVSKQDIVTAILNLAIQKIPVGNTALAVLPQTVELIEDVYGNSIDFLIVCIGAAGTTLANGAGLQALNQLGGKPQGTTQEAQFVGSFGGDGKNTTSGIVAAVPVIFDACKPTLPNGSFNPPSNTTTLSSQYQAPPDNTTQPYDDNNSNPNSQQTNPADATAVSSAHLTAPYLEWHEEISYWIQNPTAVFIPKQVGKDPVIQTTGQPTILISQQGYGTRLVYKNDKTQLPVYPDFILDGVTVLNNSITAPTSQPFGPTDWDRVTIRWNYLLQMNKAAPDDLASANLTFPDDPRRNYTGQTLTSSVLPTQSLVADV